MSRATGPSIEVTIRETLADGKSRYVARWVHQGPKGWSSADNLGRDHRAHSDEAGARRALAGWLRSQANTFGTAEAEPEPTPEADDDADLIG